MGQYQKYRLIPHVVDVVPLVDSKSIIRAAKWCEGEVVPSASDSTKLIGFNYPLSSGRMRFIPLGWYVIRHSRANGRGFNFYPAEEFHNQYESAKEVQ